MGADSDSEFKPIGKRSFERITRNVYSWYHPDAARSNHFCLYCSRFVGPGSEIASNKEHLIGREFVPTNHLDGDAFNFLFRACVECNLAKGDAERHLSAVTLSNSVGPAHSEEVNSIALRKAEKDYHPLKKGVLVKDASSVLKMSSEFPGMSIDLTLHAPPQLDRKRTWLLAGRQVQALFALRYCEDARASAVASSVLRLDCFHFLAEYTLNDWGNPTLRELSKRTRQWPVEVLVASARGYFRAIFRSHPDENEGVMFWALEWNKYLRVVGAIAPPKSKIALFEDLPTPRWILTETGGLAFETPLPAGEDDLFLPSVGSTTSLETS